MERLAGLPTVPQLGFLLRRKPSSLAFDQHKHHLCKELLAQMVLHRPVEAARLFGDWDASDPHDENPVAQDLAAALRINSGLPVIRSETPDISQFNWRNPRAVIVDV